MNKPLKDMDALCQAIESFKSARISEILLPDDNMTRDGGTEVKVPIETNWKEQQLTDKEMDISHGSMIRDKDGLLYGKTCEETLRDIVDELQDMINFIESMDLIDGCGIDDILNQLNASISAYNEGI